MGIFELFMTGFNEIGQKNWNNNDWSDANADLANVANFWPVFGLFLAFYDPGVSIQGSQCVYLSCF